MSDEEWGRLAWAASVESGLDDRPRADPAVLAAGYYGLTLAPWPRAHARLVDGVIWYPSNETPDAQAFLIGHEVSHHIVDLAGIRLVGDELERACSTIATTLLLPDRAYRRDVAAVGWDICTLRKMWPLASPWIHARRIAEICCCGAIASRWHRGGRIERVASQGLTIGARPTQVERDLAAAACRGEIVNDGGRRAWPWEGGAIVVYSVDN